MVSAEEICDHPLLSVFSGKELSVFRDSQVLIFFEFPDMLEEFFLQTGEISSVRKYLPDIDRILDYYDRHIGDDHLVGRLGYWEFVDWQEAWKDTGGVPAALQEGPSFRQFTQHAQGWAVVTGLAAGEKARRILAAAMEEEDVLRCSFSTAYEWFRALELSGMYDQAFANLNRWRGLLDRGYTTCPEEPQNERSECHAWSALPIYEFMRTIAGVHAEQGDWNRIIVQPHLSDLPDLEGCASTPKGLVEFAYQCKDGRWDYKVRIPEGVTGCFIAPDGEQSELMVGQWNYF